MKKPDIIIYRPSGKKRKAAHGVLDKYTIQEVLGKCQPRQRMWGVSGQAILGVNMTISMEQHIHTLENFCNISAAEDIVYIEGRTGLRLWFNHGGPRQAGNFVAHCCSGEHLLRSIRLEVLPPQGQ
jgi:hypothetical protein